jgi:tight adherence protein C
MLVLLAGAWGVLTAVPVARRARRHEVAARFERRAARPDVVHRLAGWPGPVARVVCGVRRRRASKHEEARLAASLSGAFDLLVAAVGAGCTPSGVVELAATWGPPPVARAFADVMVATELGGSLADALAALRTATPLLAPMADVLTASAELGTPATGALVRLADEARAGSRRRAETRARVLPVKLLFPLVFLVLPAFGLLTVVPALLSAMSRL